MKNKGICSVAVICKGFRASLITAEIEGGPNGTIEEVPRVYLVYEKNLPWRQKARGINNNQIHKQRALETRAQTKQTVVQRLIS